MTKFAVHSYWGYLSVIVGKEKPLYDLMLLLLSKGILGQLKLLKDMERSINEVSNLENVISLGNLWCNNGCMDSMRLCTTVNRYLGLTPFLIFII